MPWKRPTATWPGSSHLSGRRRPTEMTRMPRTLNPERRSATRLPLVLPICLEWLSSDDEIHRTRETTRDVSHNGVYCFLESPLSPRLPVSFAIRSEEHTSELQSLRH